MNGIPALLLALVLGAEGFSANAGKLPPAHGYTYLVTPSGKVLRVIETLPAIGAGGVKLAIEIDYATDAADVGTIITEAETLVAAFGLEHALAGETALVVRAVTAIDPLHSRDTHYMVVFERKGGGWVRSVGRDAVELSQAVEIPAGWTRPPPDPAHPLDSAGLRAAGDEASRWLALLDSGAKEKAFSSMAKGVGVPIAPQDFAKLVEMRAKVGSPGKRTELYRLQSRLSSITGDSIVFVYLQPGEGKRLLFEQVVLAVEGGAWRVAGYDLKVLSRS